MVSNGAAVPPRVAIPQAFWCPHLEKETHGPFPKRQ